MKFKKNMRSHMGLKKAPDQILESKKIQKRKVIKKTY
jgi:hypothetical protein